MHTVEILDVGQNFGNQNLVFFIAEEGVGSKQYQTERSVNAK
jgi:hypothetical protein